MSKCCNGLKKLIFLSVFLLGTAAISASAQVLEDYNSIQPDDGKASLSFAPVQLGGGAKLTLISPRELAPLADRISDSLKLTHNFFSRLFGEIPAFSTAVRLMEEESFYERTGAPRWTNAMYYRGQIIIPLGVDKVIDLSNLHRSIRHEYTHAVIGSLSASRCPGWLDEGIAQWIEGDENPALRPALRGWLKNHKPVSLKLLQGGFTRLETAMVPAAYAQSLYAADWVVRIWGFAKIRAYLDALRNGESKSKAFQHSFRLSQEDFEKRLGNSLKSWQHAPHADLRSHRH